MNRFAAVLLVSACLTGAAFAQGATSPDPVTLPEEENQVVVGGQIDRPPPPPPEGDARPAWQRARDRARFDRCVMKIQDRESDSISNPVGESAEEACSRRLGMRDRNAPPDRRRSRNQ